VGIEIERAADHIIVRCRGYSLVIGWNRGEYVNTLRGWYLYAKLFPGLVSDQPYFLPAKRPEEIAVTRYDPDIDRTLVPGWRDPDGEKKFLTSSQLADSWLRRLLESTPLRE
jgi:hypothetical protein